MRIKYIHRRNDWPRFRWNAQTATARAVSLTAWNDFNRQQETALETFTADWVASNEDAAPQLKRNYVPTPLQGLPSPTQALGRLGLL